MRKYKNRSHWCASPELFHKAVSVFRDMYDEESALYEMLHNNLGMSDNEIWEMGLNMRTSCIEIRGKDFCGLVYYSANQKRCGCC